MVDLENAEYIEVYDHRLIITVKDGEPVECCGTLIEYEKRLEPYGFVRTHKSYLVNCRHIRSLASRKLFLDDGTELPLSRYKAEMTKKRLKDFLRGDI